MTAAEIINRFDAERPNQIATNLKLAWLKKVEALIATETVLTHTGDSRWTDTSIEDHIDDFSLDTELIADIPYEDVYIYFLDMRISTNENDTKRQNVATTLYNNAMITFQAWYNRTFRPLRRRGHMYDHRKL